VLQHCAPDEQLIPLGQQDVATVSESSFGISTVGAVERSCAETGSFFVSELVHAASNRPRDRQEALSAKIRRVVRMEHRRAACMPPHVVEICERSGGSRQRLRN